ncbi:hypothetical protein MKEN_01308900 [Mycena kentingensis (nom. inval.)]|nr:hypothetical protein MKEN_01308900 [Mycena kentingensis (nom. inval.)]
MCLGVPLEWSRFLSDERITASISGVFSQHSAVDSDHSKVVGWTILLYDSFATFTEEVEFIWKTPWSLMNMVYLRYLTLVFLGVDVFVMLTPQSSDTAGLFNPSKTAAHSKILVLPQNDLGWSTVKAPNDDLIHSRS